MSKRKIPLLTKRISLHYSTKNNLNQNNNDYIQLGSLTPRFIKLYSKYIKSKQTTIYPNIHSILNNYRDEKLNKISEQEAMKEEIGEEIKKYKEIHEILKKKGPALDKEKYYNNFTSKKENELKENKAIILDTFYRYDNYIKAKNNLYDDDNSIMNYISPYKIFKRNNNSLEERIKNKYKNKTSAYFNKKKMSELLDIKIKKKPKTRNGKKNEITIKDYLSYYHRKINSYCDKINDDSVKVKINGRKTMEKFNNTWNKYRIVQEFKYPEIKKNLFEDIKI